MLRIVRGSFYWVNTDMAGKRVAIDILILIVYNY